MKFMLRAILANPLNKRQCAEQCQARGTEPCDEGIVRNVVQKVNAQRGKLLARFASHGPGKLNEEESRSVRGE